MTKSHDPFRVLLTEVYHGADSPGHRFRACPWSDYPSLVYRPLDTLCDLFGRAKSVFLGVPGHYAS